MVDVESGFGNVTALTAARTF